MSYRQAILENEVPVCRDMTELATDYLEGALPVRRSLAVRFHLSICSFCRRHYRQVRQTVSLLRRLPPEPVPTTQEDRIIGRIDDARTGRASAAPDG